MIGCRMTRNRIEIVHTFIMLTIFLGFLHLLYVNGLTQLNFFGVGPFYPDSRQLPVFAVYLATFLINSIAPESRRGTILLIGGLVGGLVAYPRQLPGLLLLVSVVYLIIHWLGKGTLVKVFALILLYSVLGWGSAHYNRTQGFFDVQLISLVFVALTFFRTLLYLRAMGAQGYPPASFADYLRYQLPVASFIIHPYLGVIPPYGGRRKPRPLKVLIPQGRRLLWIGLITLLIARIFSRILALSFPAGAYNPAGIPAGLLSWHFWAMLRMLVALLDTGASAAFLVGLMMLLGWDIKPAIEHPWFSAALFEYWNRFIIHFKDLQVSLFYYPTLLKLRNVRREVAIVVAVAMTFLVGNNVVHMFGRYLYTIERHTKFGHGVQANLALTCVMTLAFLWEEHKQRLRMAGKPVPLQGGGLLARGVRIYLTLTIVSWVWHL